MIVMVSIRTDPDACRRNPVLDSMLENVQAARAIYEANPTSEARYELCRREQLLAAAVELAGCQ
jgi:hypothetical protein|tara:strand:- start:3027 stop:3218 length:192 start_codon:yes stop_codon:yes gene_type:complete